MAGVSICVDLRISIFALADDHTRDSASRYESYRRPPRRAFLKLSATAVAACLAGCSSTADRTAQSGAAKLAPASLSETQGFNYILGTQSIGAAYQFGEETLMLDLAQAALDLRSNLLKFTMGRDYRRMMLKPSKTAYPETMQDLVNQGSDARTAPRIEFAGASVEPPPADPDIRSLVDLARLGPSYRKVFMMPFAYYMIWTYAFAPRWWNNGFSPEDQDKEYWEIYELVAHPLKAYNGTGKTFYLGHWGGDWHLRPDFNTNTDDGLSSESLRGMTNWLNTRQHAVDEAKQRKPHHGLQVYHYTEVNHVAPIAIAVRPWLTNRVLPRTKVDFVSSSTCDALDDIPNKIPRARD